MALDKKEQNKINIAFYKAVIEHDFGTAKQALDNGADVNFQYKGGYWERNFFPIDHKMRPLAFYVIEKGNVDMLNLLLENGVDVNSRKTCGWNSSMRLLSYALERHHLEMATALFEKGADPYAKDGYDKDALYWADKCGAYDLLARMKKISPLKKQDQQKSISAEQMILSEETNYGLIEHTYYFDRRERMTLAVDVSKGSIHALTMTSFDQMSKETLRAAFNTYKERGGKKTEVEVLYGVPPLGKPSFDHPKQKNG